MKGFVLYNPNGNITALVRASFPHNKRLEIANEILSSNPNCEQVGFVTFDEKAVTLEMSGGEFCGNASMCAAIEHYLWYGKIGMSKISVFCGLNEFGATVFRPDDKEFSFECTLTTPSLPVKRNEVFEINGQARELTFYEVFGITHLVTEKEDEFECAAKNIKEWCSVLSVSALGIFYMPNSFGEEIICTPVVYVSKVETLFEEKACASGCMAGAAYIFERERIPCEAKFTMPGGSIKAQASGKGIVLSEIITRQAGEND